MLSKINEQESKHVEMFNKINEKLTNDHFVQETIENSTKLRKAKMLKEALDFKKQAKMTNKDGKCY
jgi:rubrerythrin